MQKILVVEDEPAIAEMLAFTLETAHYTPLLAGDAEQAKVLLKQETIVLILLDWMLPGMSGVDLAQRLKRDPAYRQTPIIMLTARGEEEDKIKGLEVGADDYVTKPFSPKELLARIKAVLRRSAPDKVESVMEVEGLLLDPVSHRVSAEGDEFNLGPTEYRLLKFLMSHPERVFSRGQLLDQVWGEGVYVEERTVDVHIRRLRKALTEYGYEHRVQTVRGTGYRFSSR